MGFYIKITKIYESSEVARYTFSPDEERFGKIEVNKLTGEMDYIEPMEGDNRDLFLIRAAARLRQVTKNGVYPESAEWAS